jgi:hypothetical protein
MWIAVATVSALCGDGGAGTKGRNIKNTQDIQFGVSGEGSQLATTLCDKMSLWEPLLDSATVVWLTLLDVRIVGYATCTADALGTGTWGAQASKTSNH